MKNFRKLLQYLKTKDCFAENLFHWIKTPLKTFYSGKLVIFFRTYILVGYLQIPATCKFLKILYSKRVYVFVKLEPSCLQTYRHTASFQRRYDVVRHRTTFIDVETTSTVYGIQRNTCRSSHPKVPYKKFILKKLAKFIKQQHKSPQHRSLFQQKENSLKKDPGTSVSL